MQDLPGEGAFADHGWMKLMEQNKNKPSAAAQRAKNGSKIVHILPLEPDGSHPDQWGMIENGVLTKNTKKAIDQTSFEAYKNGGKKRPHQEASAVEPGKKKAKPAQSKA